MILYKTLHHSDEVDRLYVSKKGGGRELTSIEDNVDASIQRIEDFIKKGVERLISPTRINTNNTRINRTKITRKQKREEKPL